MCGLLPSPGQPKGTIPTSTPLLPLRILETSWLNDRHDGLARYYHHLNPGELIVNAARVDLCQLHIVGHHIADLMQRLLIFAACVDLPHVALVERVAPRGCFMLCGRCITHAEIPQVRIISIPSSLKRAFVQTGSQTISMLTCRIPGSCSRRARMSSIMKSMAGQPIAVKVSLRSTMPSCSASSTISPISTTLIGISGSITSRKASHNTGQEASLDGCVCRDG